MTETTEAQQIFISANIETQETPNLELKTPSSQVRTENIVPRKTVVYVTCIEPDAIKLTGEKVKQRLFTKYGLLRPNPEEIQFVSIDKYYQPYIALNGKYSIDYYRKCMYSVKVNDEVKEVVLLNNKFMPENVEDLLFFGSCRIRLEGEERIVKETKAFLILNDQGQDTSLKGLPVTPVEKDPQEFIEKNGLKLFDQNIDVNFLRRRIVKRPNNVNRIVSENFEVTERSVVYVPVYKLKYAYSITGEQKTVEFSGVTSQKIKP